MKRASRLRVMITADAVGGVWTYATGLAVELARRGHEILVVVLGPSPSRDQLGSLSGIRGLEIEVTDLALEWMDPEGKDLGRATRVLRSIMRRFAPDVAHINGYRDALVDHHAPKLVIAHSCVRSWWRACRGGDPDEPPWQAYARHVAEGLAAADVWVAPTHSFRDTIFDLYGPPSRGVTIHNGIPLAPARWRKQPVLLAAGRIWDAAKNIGAVVAAAEHLRWPIRIAGPGHAPSGDDGNMLGASDVEWLGPLSRPRLLAEMQSAEMFLAPALYEPFGLTIAEAASCGCVLVLSDIASLRELWDGAALFVDPHEPGALTTAVLTLTGDLGRRQKLRNAARMRALRYSLSRMADDYEALYWDLQERDVTRHVA